MRLSLWSAEFINVALAMLAQVGTQATSTPTAPVSAAAPDPAVLPTLLGIPIGTWVAILGVGGTGAVLSTGLLSLVKTGVGAVQTLGEDLPIRLKADREREGVETLNLKEEVRFAQIVNEALKDSRDQIISLQGIITQMQQNDVQRSAQFLAAQQLMLDQGATHHTEMERQNAQHRGELETQATQHRQDMEGLNKRLDSVKQTNDLQSKELQEKIQEADRWREMYEQEHQRAEGLAERLREYESGKIAPVKVEIVSVPALPAQEIPSDPPNNGSDSALPELPSS